MLISYSAARVDRPASEDPQFVCFDGSGAHWTHVGSSGLRIATIADNEATATAYTGANLETVTTLGTFAAPTSGKARFREVDSTNHPGIYEIQVADARFAVSAAKSVLISISGATNAAECDVLVPLTGVDPYDPRQGHVSARRGDQFAVCLGELHSPLDAAAIRAAIGLAFGQPRHAVGGFGGLHRYRDRGDSRGRRHGDRCDQRPRPTTCRAIRPTPVTSRRRFRP